MIQTVVHDRDIMFIHFNISNMNVQSQLSMIYTKNVNSILKKRSKLFKCNEFHAAPLHSL